MLTQTENLGVSPDFHFDLPEYRCGTYGAWTLKHKPGDSLERGYFTGTDTEPPGYYLVRNGDIWMSTSRLERESHAVHLKHARGNVVVCGIGMGMYLYNIAAHPLVEQIIAVDIDAEIIDLVQQATDFQTWPGKSKIRFVNKDAMQLTAGDIGMEQVDYLYVDIWPELGNPRAVAQTQAIQAVVNARTVGWWGQEIDFIDWLFHHWPKQQQPALADFVDFTESIGLPIEEHTAAYLLGCRQAGTVFATYGSLPFAVSQRKRR